MENNTKAAIQLIHQINDVNELSLMRDLVNEKIETLLKAAAKEFVDSLNLFQYKECPVCKASNCIHNDSCIQCNCQF